MLQKRWPEIVITVFAFVLYAGTLSHDYALDDVAIITQNSFVQQGVAGIPKLLTTAYWEGAKGVVNFNGAYRPASPILFAIEYQFFGLNPAVGHWVNVLLYILTGWLIFGAARFFIAPLFRDNHILPLLVTLLFLSHPLHTEVVANIKSRDALLALLFLLLALQQIIQFIRHEKQPYRHMLLGAGFFFLAMMSKENSITFVGTAFFVLWLFGKNTLIKNIKYTLPFLAMAGVFLLIFFNVTEINSSAELHVFDNAFAADESPQTLLATRIAVLGKYLQLLFYPHPLIYDYSFRHIAFVTWTDYSVWLSILAYGAMAAYLTRSVFWKFQGKVLGPRIAFKTLTVAWFLFGFLLLSNLFFLIGSTMAERFLYESSLPFCLLVVVLIALWTRVKVDPKSKKLLRGHVVQIICVVAILGFSWKTIDRNKAWKDNATLFATDIEFMPNNAKAHHNLAGVYQKQGDSVTDPDLKRQYYLLTLNELTAAINIYPALEFYDGLGNINGLLGHMDHAITWYQQSISISPNRALPHMKIGMAYGMQRKFTLATEHLEMAARMDPKNFEIFLNLGKTYGIQGNNEKAVANFNTALELSPGNRQVLQALMLTYTNGGNLQAAEYYRKLLGS